MSTCKKFEAKLSEYLDGYLAGPDMNGIEKHLQECRKCNNEFQQMRELKSSLSLLTKHKTSPHFDPVLYSKLRSPKSQPFNIFSSLNLKLQVPIYVGAAAILILAGLFLGQSHLIVTPFAKNNNVPSTFEPAEKKQGAPNPGIIPATHSNTTVALKKSNDIIYF